MTAAEEQEVLAQIRKDRKAFGILFDHYYHTILSYVFRRLGNYDLAKDITAETFLKAFLKIHTFSWQGHSVSAWIYRIATNEMNQYFRKRRYEASTLQKIVGHESFPTIQNSEEERAKADNEWHAHQDFATLQRILATLPIRYQEVIALRYFEEKSTAEVAAILGRPEGTIKSLLSRGIKKLQAKMQRNSN